MTHVALWDFNDSSTVTDDITSDGAAQGGTYEYGASASGGKLQLDGVDDYALIPADPVFQLACGTLVTEFNPDTLQNAVLLSRDSNGNDNGGHFELRLDDSGQISVRTQDSTLSSFYETPSGFYTAGDDIRVTFSWDHGGSGGEYKVENLTQGTKHSQPVSSNVTWDMGSGYNEPITIGANQDLSSDNTADNLREFFSGSVSYVSLFDEVVDPGGPVMPVSGTPNDDMLTGTGIRDDISGLEGDDNLKGGAGDDTLRGGGGNDWLSGLGGDDTLVGGAGADTMFGGSGDDFVSYWNSESGVNVDLLTNKSSGGSAQGDKIYDVEGVIGSDHADTITGSIGNDTLLGGAGDDRIVGGRGSDTLNGGTGNDTFVFTSATSNDWVEDFDFGDDDGDGYTNDQLDVSGLTSDGGTTPVTTDDVVLKSTGHNGSGSAVLVFPGGERITLGGISPHLVNDLAVLHAMGIPLGTKDGVVNGTNSNDSIVSGYIDSDGDAVDSNDNLAGNNHDFIDARAGNDTISAGAGNDTVFGGSGNDLVFGGTEDDWLEGDSGSDTLYAGNGSDTISGGDGYDFLYGDAGDDVIFGGDGGDIIAGGARDDSLFGGDGNDELYGGGGYDVDVGGADTLVGGAGQDIMAGGAGDDVFVFADGSGKDQINDFDFRDANADGYANDQLDVSGLTAAGGTTSVTTDDVVITDANGDGTGDAILTFPGGESIRLVGITAAKVSDPMVLHAMGIPLGIRYGVVDGTAGDDTIHGSYVDAEGDAIGSGNDMVAAGDGDDDVFTEGGDDSVSGGDGNDIINGGAGADVLDGGAGNDTVRYSSSTEAVVVDLSTNTTSGGDATGDVISGFENVWGGAGDDTLTGDDAGNSFAGGAGNDSISGGGGNDRFHGGQGADTLDGGTGSNYLTYYSDTVGVNVDLVTGVGLGGEAEGDVISNIQHIEGGKGNDTLTGDMADNVLYGHGGDDIISGGDGDDGIIGGPGADTLDGGAGSDWVDYFHSTAGVTVDFSTNTASGGEAMSSQISSIFVAGRVTTA
jgi:Ca2+-binding RTX toxin-like protein